jgi:hypothetical protein
VVAAVALAGLFLAAGLAFLVLVVLAAARRFPRATGAHAVERAEPGLLDRLNTLVALQGRREEAEIAPYFHRIEAQARDTLLFAEVPFPFSRRPALRSWAACLAVVAATAWFYVHFEPWEALSSDPEVY